MSNFFNKQKYLTLLLLVFTVIQSIVANNVVDFAVHNKSIDEIAGKVFRVSDDNVLKIVDADDFVGYVRGINGVETLAKYPKDNFLEFVNSTFTPAQKQKFNTAKNFYESFNPSFDINELRGIDYDLVVTNVVKQENTVMYQLVTIDEVTGNPRFGSYFFENINEDITKLGVGDLNRISSDGRVKVKIILNDDVDFLKSTSANIEDWSGTGVIFEGGGNQYYNPLAKNKIKSYEIIETY